MIKINEKNIIKKLKKNQITIYLFHGVINKKIKSMRNYTGKHIEKKKFQKLMKKLSKHGNPISINDAVLSLQGKNKIKSKSFVITFDDGFYNNISVAYPILKKLNIPFTIYLTTKFIDKNSMSWVDQIEYCVDKTKNKEILIPKYNKKFLITNNKEKINLMNFIRKRIKLDKKCNPNLFAKKMIKKLGFKNNLKSKLIIVKKLSWSDVRMYKNDRLITFGGHSHSHLTLGFLNNKILNKEIGISVKKIKKHLNLKNIHYSYPEGSEITFTKKVIDKLKDNNVISSVTTIDGSNKCGQDLYRLKRVFVA